MLREFDILFSEEEDENLKSLGIDCKADSYVDKGMVDIDRIESFYPCRKKFEGKDTINVIMFSGDIFTLIASMKDLKDLIS